MTPYQVIALSVAGLAAVLVAWYVIALFNSLIQVRNNIEKAWANIDVLLKQRHDEMPALVEVLKGYMQHERELLESVTRLRAGYDNAACFAEKVAIENQFNREIRNIGSAVENYPDLKANRLFLDFQARITVLESQIADRREFFNDSVNIYNIQIERFPERLFASLLNFRRESFLEAPAGEKAVPAVQLAVDPQTPTPSLPSA